MEDDLTAHINALGNNEESDPAHAFIAIDRMVTELVASGVDYETDCSAEPYYG